MYCKYCGKKLDGNMEVCPECEEKISNGENPFFSVPTYRDPVKELKNDLALREQNADASGANQVAATPANPTAATPGGEPAANPTTVAPNGEPTVNPTAATPVNPAPSYHGGGSENRNYGPRFSETYNGVGYGGYTRTSGLVLGILSVALPWACLITSLISVSLFFWNPVVAAVSIVLTFLAGIIVSLVFGIKAIVEFKRAKRSGVAPVPTLVLGIVGLAQIATFLLFVTDVFRFDTIL